MNQFKVDDDLQIAGRLNTEPRKKKIKKKFYKLLKRSTEDECYRDSRHFEPYSADQQSKRS
ncbi:hypothetical protein OS493_003830 [Desmophyllum pertusum]|uniref:Uncharacterized protein n=1 Tax=Desmophyllum pertusum TaxID=174260 RepID=A0A9X0DC22_9CNID|nr:hypothetical protein OS493_003830 [Desmophyllum pertusum]